MPPLYEVFAKIFVVQWLAFRDKKNNTKIGSDSNSFGEMNIP